MILAYVRQSGASIESQMIVQRSKLQVLVIRDSQVFCRALPVLDF